MSIIKNNINYVLAQGRKYLSKVKTQYQNFLRRVQDDGGQLLNIFEDYKDYINNPERIYQLPMARKAGKLYRLNEDDYSVIANGERFEFTRDGVYREVGVDVPRFDWSNGKQELLVEGQSTNEISNNTDIINGSIFSPLRANLINEGNFNLFNSNVDLFSLTGESGTSPNHFLNSSTISVPNGDYTISYFVKYSTNQWIAIQQGTSVGGTLQSLCYFDIQNKVLGSNLSGNAIDYGIEVLTDGWCRVWMKTAVIAGVIVPRLYLAYEDVGMFFTSNGTEQVLFSLPQVERGDLSSPILTNGSIVTRPADIITNSQGQLAVGRYDTV